MNIKKIFNVSLYVYIQAMLLTVVPLMKMDVMAQQVLNTKKSLTECDLWTFNFYNFSCFVVLC